MEKHFQQSKENLLKTSLFNFVEIQSSIIDNQFLNVTISVVERWYLWPIPIFEQASRNINTWIYEKDYNKVNYGFFIAQANFRGRDELIRAIVRFGFREQFGFAYTIPHLFQSNHFGLEIKTLFYRQKQVAYKNENNKPLYIINNSYLYNNQEHSITITYRPRLYTWHIIELAYQKEQISNTLAELNPNFIYHNFKLLEYPYFSYTFLFDKTNSNSYPTRGGSIELEIDQSGFTNKFSLTELYLTTRYFYSTFSRLFHGHGISFKASNLKYPSYIFSKAFGYKTSPRGMELYLVDGKGFFLSSNSIRYQIVKPHVINIYKLKNERFAKLHYAFYLSLNGDLGYVFNDYNEPLTNQWLYGYGIGLDFITYYDLVFRAEFSINQFKETGLFFHISTFI